MEGGEEDLIFLDTHIVVWLASGKIDRFSKKAMTLIENSTILISPIVKLELQYLFEIKRITEDSKSILEYLENKIGLMVNGERMIKVIDFSLNEAWTRDPFDRIIVSEAKLNNTYLITADNLIQKNYEKALI